MSVEVRVMTKKTLIRELSGRTGLTERQISKVLTELRSLTNKRTSKSANGRNGTVHIVSGYQGLKLRFTKKEALASVHRRPTFAELISELEKD
jgi:predicted DNA-binding transcriptional regulator YafY